MKQPEADPRLFEKNFAMAMGSALLDQGGSESASPRPMGRADVPVRQKEGYVPPPVSIPSYGGRSTHEVVKIPSRASASSVAIPPLWLQGVDSGHFKCSPGTVDLVFVKYSGVNLSADTEIPFTGTAYVFVLATVVFGNSVAEDVTTATIVTSSQSTYPGVGTVGPSGYSSAYLLGVISSGGAVTNYGTGGNLGVESFGNTVFWWKW